MPKKLQKSLQDYLPKIKKPSPQIHLSSSKTWILSGCKHPKTLSFAVDHNQVEAQNNNDTATLADVDRFLFDNFRSLFLGDDDCNGKNGEDESESKIRERFTCPPPDICNPRIFAGRSLMEKAPASITWSSEEFGSSSYHGKSELSLPNDCVTVLTRSSSLWKDLRRSMEEIVEEHLENKGGVDWDFMKDLLFCCLDLNEKKSHKYILNAYDRHFAEALRRSFGEVAEYSGVETVGGGEKRLKY